MCKLHFKRYKMVWPPEVMPCDQAVSRATKELVKRMLGITNVWKVKTQVWPTWCGHWRNDMEPVDNTMPHRGKEVPYFRQDQLRRPRPQRDPQTVRSSLSTQSGMNNLKIYSSYSSRRCVPTIAMMRGAPERRHAP